MEVAGRRVFVCNCEKTMDIDAKALARACGARDLNVHTNLCRTELGNFADAVKAGEPMLVCCTQEAPLFTEIAEDAGAADIARFANIRERAGWSEDGSNATAKMAALIAEAGLDITPAGTTTLASDGICLVYGKSSVAFDIARKLSGRLSVTLLLTEADDAIPPSVVDVPVFKGLIKAAAGHLGAFEIVVDGYAPAVPSSKTSLEFIMPRNGAASACSLIIDVSGNDPLFATAGRRDGYFHVDPASPLDIANAMFEASDLVGEFEKPLYVSYDADICAHSRSAKTGCTRCLDACPVSAISPDGDHVKIDPAICGGCGSCASVCPTGATSYALPGREDLIKRLQTLLPAYEAAGGKTPWLLVHDERHGSEMISMMSRFGRGLPANVIPFAVNETTQIGHDLMTTALALGAQGMLLLIDPARRDEIEGLAGQAELASAILAAMDYEAGANRIAIIDETDPDAVEAILWQRPEARPMTAHAFIASGDKRQVARTAAFLLNADAPSQQDVIALPDGAPYGRISINTDGCTMCLACVSACPMGAIRDNPDLPQVRFIEQDCVQCGLCRTTCPESVITLEARLNLTNEAMSPAVLNEEEPAECTRCGKPFGTKSSIERIVAQLAGKHSMFQSEHAQNLIRMCDDCRIIQQTENMGSEPFASAPRPAVRTTADDLAEREEAKARDKSKDN